MLALETLKTGEEHDDERKLLSRDDDDVEKMHFCLNFQTNRGATEMLKMEKLFTWFTEYEKRKAKWI